MKEANFVIKISEISRKIEITQVSVEHTVKCF